MAVIGRPREFDRDAALEAAMLLFWRKGFAGDLDERSVRRHGRPLAEPLCGLRQQGGALSRSVRALRRRPIGPPVWDKLAEGATARAGVEKSPARGDRDPARIRDDAGRLHGGAGAPSATNGRPRSPTRSGKSGSTCWACCGRGWKLAVADGELPASTDIERLEPVLSQRLPGHGRPGPGRRHAGGTERRRRSGDGGVAGRRVIP